MELMEFEETLHHKLNEEQLLNHLTNCLKSLNEEQRNCVTHFYLNQKSYLETAGLTGFFRQTGKKPYSEWQEEP